MPPWGFHAVLNLYRCAPATIRCANNIWRFNADLVKQIDMKAFGAPSIVHFGTGNKAGYTLVQLIETSNIMGHFVEETNDAYLDVFSCKPFSPTTVRQVVQQYFSPENLTLHMLRRQALPPTVQTRWPITDVEDV
jgi:S-adenosylmethionine/arginine decarboxylase-like enzyme